MKTTTTNSPSIVTDGTAAAPLVITFDRNDLPDEVKELYESLDELHAQIGELVDSLLDPPLNVEEVIGELTNIELLAMGLDVDQGEALAEAARRQAVAEHAARHARTPA